LSFPQFIRLTFHATGAEGTVIGYEIIGQFETKILRYKQDSFISVFYRAEYADIHIVTRV